MAYQRQRIRDPLYNLIEFRDNDFENAMWRAIQTRPFQRLRRVKQLGFSELVYPGATHSRFAHSVGVFHTARQLMSVIERHLTKSAVYKQAKANAALAAALLHDIGHGPFSHAFEDVSHRLGLNMANHETLSKALIQSSEVSGAFEDFTSGFAVDVADVIGREGPRDIYDAVVSSQFDADRLDYMRRDRLMTGTHHGAIDFDWLVSNIEVGEVPFGVDEEKLGKIETFVLGPKATYAVESYLLGLFQLYPTVYFHKTTRGAEKLFSELLCQTIQLVRQGHTKATGLSANHPLVVFAKHPEKSENFLQLDDAVIWGSLSLMACAHDPVIQRFSKRLRDRKLFKCIDVREEIIRDIRDPNPAVKIKKIDGAQLAVGERLREWMANNDGSTRILIDEAKRSPYRRSQESKGPLNQIMLRSSGGELVNVAELSKVVAAIETFILFRVYTAEDDSVAIKMVKEIISEEVAKTNG